jgi:hypothetical protein
MSASDSLTRAMAAVAEAEARAAELAAKLAAVRAEDLAITDEIIVKEKQLTAALGLELLNDLSVADLEAIRGERDALHDRCRATASAIDLLETRLREQERAIELTRMQLTAVMADVAVPLREQALANVTHHARELALALSQFHRLDNTTRSGYGNGGFLTGSAAEIAAGSPGSILADRGIRATNDSLLPQYRDRIDDLKPKQLLAMLTASL